MCATRTAGTAPGALTRYAPPAAQAFAGGAQAPAKRKFTKIEVQPEWLEGASAGCSSGDARRGEPGKLREYQMVGLNWLYRQWAQNINTILADEMGLGKTLQTVAFLAQLSYGAPKIKGPFLVVVPLITVDAWLREFRKWVPGMNCVVLTGNRKCRSRIFETEFYGQNGSRGRARPAFEVLITTYEMLILPDVSPELGKIKWEFLAVDGAKLSCPRGLGVGAC